MLTITRLLTAACCAVLLSACTAAQPAAEAGANDHDTHMTTDAPFDAAFIDSMIEHHEGAIAMAEEVKANGERPELLALADAIITAQTAEIAQMQEWRAAWFPDLAPTAGVGMDMGDMGVPADDGTPFDQRFLVAMISHHQGAIAMAEMALEHSERPEIRTLAEAIIAAQTSEIEQMRAWLADWYNVTQ
jgi:uncharacterized protein (DUF305 family)